MKKVAKILLYDYPYISMFLIYINRASKLYFKYYTKILKHLIKVIIRKFALSKPKVLQFPITYKCNFDCVMCGMQKMSNQKDMDINDLEKILSNPLFSRVRSVGLNGGEPFLVSNIDDYIRIIINKIPKLKNIFIITNGYLTERILCKLEIIKKECESKSIKLTVSISIDAIGEKHDEMRGRKDVFRNVEDTCLAISKTPGRYCDDFGVICTVTKTNIISINEVDYWATKNNIKVSYNIATVHKRLFNEDRYGNFSVLTDEYLKGLATEWFYYKFRRTNSEQYYSIYRYLLEGKRTAECDYQYDGVTLLPNGDISYCATQSKVLGNSITEPADIIFESNLDYKKQLIASKCDKCSHYSGSISIYHYKDYIKDILWKPFKYRV